MGPGKSIAADFAVKVSDRTLRDDRRRARCRARVRLHRQRLGHGKACATVVFDGAIVDVLCRSGWLSDSAACSRTEVGRAIGRLLADIAEHS
jgi:hypothetical protein